MVIWGACVALTVPCCDAEISHRICMELYGKCDSSCAVYGLTLYKRRDCDDEPGGYQVEYSDGMCSVRVYYAIRRRGFSLWRIAETLLKCTVLRMSVAT